MMFIAVGCGFIVLAALDIYRGRTSLIIISRWFMGQHVDRDKDPWLFWFCVGVELILAVLCFAGAAGVFPWLGRNQSLSIR